MSTSSTSNTNEPKEIQTMEIDVPQWAVVSGITIALGTLSIVHFADHFGPDNYSFKRTFYFVYMTYWVALVACCCADAKLVKKKKEKSVEQQQQQQGRLSRTRRSGWV